MKKNNQSRAVGKGRVLLVLFFLTISLSACSGLNLNFFGDKKAEAETESKDKENKEEDKAYIIQFLNDDLLMNPKSGKEEEVQKNIIQSVRVTVMKK